MSGEGQWFEERLFADLPHWKELIDKCLWDDQIHGLVASMDLPEDKRRWLGQMAEKEPEVFKQIERFLGAGDGGKYPPLWGIGINIDDNSRGLGRQLSQLGPYGFTAINPLSETGEAPDAWVDRVLSQVDAWRVEQ